jgi:ABC-type iron transport system FetAB permease component
MPNHDFSFTTPFQQLDELSSSKTTMSGASSSANLTWANVAIGLAFIAFDAVLSLILGLGIGGSLIVAATRCIVQLTVMGLVLDKVFAAQNVVGVAGIACRLSRLEIMLAQTSLALQNAAYRNRVTGCIILGW